MVDGLIPPETLGIREVAEWRELMEQCFAAYQSSVAFWEELVGRRESSLMGIPPSLLNDTSDAARKVMRMRRNYAFDRTLYYFSPGGGRDECHVDHVRARLG